MKGVDAKHKEENKTINKILINHKVDMFGRVAKHFERF